MWNTPNFTFSSRFLRLSSSNGRAPWRYRGGGGGAEERGKKSCQTEKTTKQIRQTKRKLSLGSGKAKHYTAKINK